MGTVLFVFSRAGTPSRHDNIGPDLAGRHVVGAAYFIYVDVVFIDSCVDGGRPTIRCKYVTF